MNLFGLTPEDVLGRPTLHLPINLIVQSCGDGDKVTGVFQSSSGASLIYGSTKTHQLILGDVFLRPRLVFESDEFRGSGLASLAMHGFADTEMWQNGLLFKRE